MNKLEQQLSNPERISSKALRYIMGEIAVLSASSESEQIEAIKARIEYELRLRSGQGEG